MKRRQVCLGVPCAVAGLLVPRRSEGCLWHRDTLTMEAKSFPGTVRVVTGRFARNPKRHYKLRQERLTAEITPIPEHFALYDDLGVAADRLGQGNEAMDWMARKKGVLDANPGHAAHKEHLYRYWANLGTMEIHEWIRMGAPSDDLSLAQEARKHIAEAIRLNPDAHFGREPYQFMAIDWLIRTHQGSETSESFLGQSQIFDRMIGPVEIKKGPIEGVSGLIVLGDAWNSVDVFRTLSSALKEKSKSNLAYLAALRVAELKKKGGNSVVGSGSSEKNPSLAMIFGILSNEDRESNRQFFKAARAEADQWQAARTAFMEAQYDLGKHPDTHEDFWKSAKYDAAPPKFDGKEVS